MFWLQEGAAVTSLHDVTPPPLTYSLLKEVFEMHDLSLFVQSIGCPPFPASLPTGRNYSETPGKLHLSFEMGLEEWGELTSPCPEMVQSLNSYLPSDLWNMRSTSPSTSPFSCYFSQTWVHIIVFAATHAHRARRSVLGIFPDHSPYYFLRQIH